MGALTPICLGRPLPVDKMLIMLTLTAVWQASAH